MNSTPILLLSPIITYFPSTMKTTLISALLLPLLLSSVFAADDDDVTCQTKLGKESVADVQTVTVTKTDSVAPTTTTTRIPTVVKKANQWSTITVFSTKTFTVTGKGGTDTFSTTTTLFKVATVVVTSTSTKTSTKTGTRTSTSTTQIPTTAGFKFISDTVNSRSLNAQKRDRLFQKPHARAIIKPGIKAFKFPSKVQCTSLIYIFIYSILTELTAQVPNFFLMPTQRLSRKLALQLPRQSIVCRQPLSSRQSLPLQLSFPKMYLSPSPLPLP